MSESKNNVVISKREFELLKAKSIFLAALVEVGNKYPTDSGVPFTAVMDEAEQYLRDKAAEID